MCKALIILGAAFQVGGFALTLFEALSIRRRELPDSPPLLVIAGRQLARLWRWLGRGLRRGLRAIGIKVPIVYRDSGVATIHGGGGLSAEGHAVRGGTLDRRVALVEEALAKVERDIALTRAELQAGIAQVVGEVEEQRLVRLRRSLVLQEAGVFAFLIGVVLTAVGSVA